MLPVVITHRGNQEYFQLVVRQALSYNERVILIGDESNENTPGVEYYPEREFYASAVEFFERRYIHMHSGPLNRERACFTRWLLIDEMARRLDFPVVFTCDSDLMLYTNVSAAEPLGMYDMACSVPTFQPEFRWSASGHVSYWRRDVLTKFCGFINYTYTNPEAFQHLKSKWVWHQETNKLGGICDMTLLWLFIQNESGVYIDLATPVRGTVFDHNFNEGGRYRMARGVKEIEWRDDQPYGYDWETSSWVRFNAIHFQGVAKKVLKQYFRLKER